MQIYQEWTEKHFEARPLEGNEPMHLGLLPPESDWQQLVAQGQLLGGFDRSRTLAAATVALPLASHTALAENMRAAGFSHSGEGVVLTPLQAAEGYGQERRFFRYCLRSVLQHYPSSQVWALLPTKPASADLCEAYMLEGMVLRRSCLLDSREMLVFSAQSLPAWNRPVQRVPFRRLAWLADWLQKGWAARGVCWRGGELTLELQPAAGDVSLIAAEKKRVPQTALPL